MSEVGALSIRITADGGQATRELDTVGKRIQQTGKQLRDNANRWAKWGIAAAAAAGAVVVAMTRAGMQSVDTLGSLAQTLDTSVESLQALQSAASDTGLDGLESSLARLNRRLGAAEFGGGAAAATVRMLNLSLEEMAEMAADERLGYIAQRINDAGISSEQAARHLQNLGFEQAQALQFFREGAANIDVYRERIDALGFSLNDIDAAKVGQAASAMSFFGEASQAISQHMAVEFAPILTALAKRMEDAAIEAGGLGNIITDVMDGAVTAVGFFADALRGLNLIWHGARAAAFGYAQFVTNMWARLLEGLNQFMRMSAEGVNILIRGMNRVPGVNLNELIVGESKAAETLRKWSNDMGMEMADSVYQLHEAANKPLPSEHIRRFVDEAREASQEAAEIMIQARENMGGDGSDSDPPAFAFSKEENEKWLEQLRERYMTEAELQIEAHEGELERLQELKQQELLTEQEYENERERMAMSHAESMASIQEQERRQRVGIMSGMMNNLSQLMNTGSKKMFAIGKAAAIANALLQGKEAVLSSYAAGAKIGGPYLGAAYAATAAAATFAQIQQIRSSSFGGAGGGANTFAGGVPAVRTTDAGNTGPQQPGQTVDINIAGSGNSFSIDQVRELIGQINEQAGDGVNLAFNG